MASPIKLAASASSAAGSPSPLEHHTGLLDCPYCFVPLIRIKSKQPDTKDQYYIKCPFNVKVNFICSPISLSRILLQFCTQGDPTACEFIRSEEQCEVWARKRRCLMQSINGDTTDAIQSGEAFVDWRNEIK